MNIELTVKAENVKMPEANSKEFFDFQIAFAQQMHRVTKESLNFCLFNYTNIYRRFGLSDKPRNEENPAWKDFIEAATTHKDLGAVAFAIRQDYESKKDELNSEHTCFSYEYNTDTKTVHIHFSNKDKSAQGPLGEDRVPVRLSELKEIFSEIQSSHPEAEKVKGSSWLYNLNSYRRLFPAEYIQKLTKNISKFNGMGVWGQFNDKHSNFKIEMAEDFMRKVTKAQTMEEVFDAFPFMRHDAECDIAHFYKHLGIQVLK